MPQETTTEQKQLYYYDGNRRVYKMNGVERNWPFERGYFVPINILSENSKEFICEYGYIKKRSMMYTIGRAKYKVFTAEQMEDHIFIAENAVRIAGKVRDASADVLRQVQAILEQNNIQ